MIITYENVHSLHSLAVLMIRECTWNEACSCLWAARCCNAAWWGRCSGCWLLPSAADLVEWEPQHSWHQLGGSSGGSRTCPRTGHQGSAAAASQLCSVSYESKLYKFIKCISCSMGAKQLFCGTSTQCIIIYILMWCFSYAYCFVFSFC